MKENRQFLKKLAEREMDDGTTDDLSDSALLFSRIYQMMQPHIYGTINGALNICESPIERLFLAAFIMINTEEYLEFTYITKLGRCTCDTICMGSLYPRLTIGIQEVQPSGYRPDFRFSYKHMVKDESGKVTLTERNLMVECDGHEFHEKTKEQAKRDKKRDREFQKDGFSVMHYTGSEIHNDPFGCASEVLSFLLGESTT